MTLSPDAARLLEKINGLQLPAFEDLGPEGARRNFDAAPPASDLVEVAHVEDRAVPGPGGEVAVRVYTPEGVGPFPVLVYLHGGGWVLGSLDSHDRECRILTAGARCVTVAVDYRLAPEHPFPAAPEDAYAALCWVAANAAEIGGDPAKLAVGGDSAGGNLAAAVALMARDRSGPTLALQALIYPVTDFDADTPSMRQNAEGYVLTRSTMRWFHDAFCAAADRTDPYAAPLRAPTTAGVAPAHVIVAGYDPLRDEGVAYARALIEGGVRTTLTCYPGAFHGFFSMNRFLADARTAQAEVIAALRGAWS
jgi:acetyl esterase